MNIQCEERFLESDGEHSVGSDVVYRPTDIHCFVKWSWGIVQLVSLNVPMGN